MKIILIIALFLMALGIAFAWNSGNVEVIIDGSRAQMYDHHGTTYIEAIKGKKIFNTNYQSARSARCGGVVG